MHPEMGQGLEVFEEFRPRMFGIAYRMLGSVADAEDIVQQTALTLWEKFDAYDSSQAFTPWACRFALNKTKQWIERRQRWQALLAPYLRLSPEAPAASPPPPSSPRPAPPRSVPAVPDAEGLQVCEVAVGTVGGAVVFAPVVDLRHGVPGVGPENDLHARPGWRSRCEIDDAAGVAAYTGRRRFGRRSTSECPRVANDVFDVPGTD